MNNLVPANKNGFSPMLVKESYSQNKKTIYRRSHYLINDDEADKQKERSKKRHNKTRQKSLSFSSKLFCPPSRLKTQVIHHLARGRDVADIIIRERVEASRVLEIINELEKEKANINA